jgi:hypothetical protein
MTNQTRAAMQGALLALEDAHRRDEHSAARWVYSEAMDDLREALAQRCPDCGEVNPAEIHTCSPQLKQPQGEWVDLTPHEVTEQIREGAADGGWQGFAQRITAKFKEKNTPPVVPQGEPVAWHHPKCDGQCIACLIEKAVEDAYGTQGRDYMLRHINAAPIRTKDLTHDEVEALFWKWKSASEYPVPLFEFRDIARAVIAADREKNK